MTTFISDIFEEKIIPPSIGDIVPNFSIFLMMLPKTEETMWSGSGIVCGHGKLKISLTCCLGLKYELRLNLATITKTNETTTVPTVTIATTTKQPQNKWVVILL